MGIIPLDLNRYASMSVYSRSGKLWHNFQRISFTKKLGTATSKAAMRQNFVKWLYSVFLT